MMEIIEDLPEGVIGIAAKGKITHEDYIHTVIPAVERALEKHKKVNILFYFPHYEGMELQAMWDDTRFGLSHWTDFSRLALVTDETWIKNVTAFFAHMIPAEVQIFKSADLDTARQWVSTGIERKAA